MSQKVWVTFFALLICLNVLFGKEEIPVTDPLASNEGPEQAHWVDSVFHSMSFEERIGQLFMVAAYSNKGEQHKTEITRLIREHKIGGLIFFQGGPVRQANLTNYYQTLSKTPLFIAMDGEWGVSMRLDSTLRFPKQMTLGAIQDTRLIYDMGREIAGQFKALGMHINFAPVVDVNSNPDNPVIGYRAFGEEKTLVARNSLAYMKGLQDHGIMANAKHFPGHGDTDLDSHYTTPVINNSRQQIMDIDLYPYRQLIENGLMSVMVAHLHVPSLGSQPDKPTTLSKNVVTGLLKEEMNFKGLIFTDALNMKGVSNLYKPGEVDLLALLAGNDILLYAEDVPKSKTMILEAVKQGKISREEIDQRVRKILKAKFWAGLNQPQKIDTHRLADRINSFETRALIEKLYAAAITVTSNENNFLPLKNLDLLTMASVTIGSDGSTFKKHLDKYHKVAHYNLGKNSGAAAYRALEEKLDAYNTVVVGITGVSNSPKNNHGIRQADIDFIKKLTEKHNVVTVLFGNSYAARFIDDLPHVLVAYEENEFTEKLVPQVIFGGRSANGKLPVTVSAKLPAGTGRNLEGMNRLGYTSPESHGMDSYTLAGIDRIMEKAIANKYTPGGVVLVAKDGDVVFEKAYGYYDYEKTLPVSDSTIYDLASITKVLATTQMVMFLESRDLIDLEQTVGHYLPELRGTNKENIKIKDIMTHESGLLSWIPHYTNTLEQGKWKTDFYRKAKEEGYGIAVAQDMYASDALPDSLWKWVVESPLRKIPKGKTKPAYLYSDLGMYILKRIVERQVNQPMNEFLSQNFYEPLGLYSLTYQPLEKFGREKIAPTENDKTFRRRVVQGYVHDQGAAMMGGVGGHAGLFGTANDVAIIMQMMLQQGNYGGVNLLEGETIGEFVKRQSAQSRRAWGWDKPALERDKGGNAGVLAPKSSFGHTGFTGTAVWADPENNLVYVFLSNRTFPYAGQNGLLKHNIRTEIHDLIYMSFKEQEKNIFLTEQN
ncbi:MAG TPA: glycoside hydrolase family 3 N-terminal domain-containing protein [Cyclobacteriaceae bacterium]|nr:glycoside hydrolase family 3 N-terminal domain-containing protein [Cyclobacteriaceae bacterium]